MLRNLLFCAILVAGPVWAGGQPITGKTALTCGSNLIGMGRRFDFDTPEPLHLLVPAGALAEFKLHEPMIAWLLDCDSALRCEVSTKAGVGFNPNDAPSSITIDSVRKNIWSGSYYLVMKNGDTKEGRFTVVAKKEKTGPRALVCPD